MWVGRSKIAGPLAQLKMSCWSGPRYLCTLQHCRRETWALVVASHQGKHQYFAWWYGTLRCSYRRLHLPSGCIDAVENQCLVTGLPNLPKNNTRALLRTLERVYSLHGWEISLPLATMQSAKPVYWANVHMICIDMEDCAFCMCIAINSVTFYRRWKALKARS